MTPPGPVKSLRQELRSPIQILPMVDSAYVHSSDKFGLSWAIHTINGMLWVYTQWFQQTEVALAIKEYL